MPKRRRMPNRAPIARRPTAAAAPSRSSARPAAPDEPVERRLGLAMLPLRAFLGFAFLYAGLDKLVLDTTFLDPRAPTSILAQLQGFARNSPLGPLISVIGEPLAIPIGFLIALGEIAVGLGVLSGLLLRLSAWAGAALAMLLWLTASWSVHPFYLGPDLPYAMGFVTLALVGDGGVLTLRGRLGRWAWRQGLLEDGLAWDTTAEPLTGSTATPSALDLSRRRFLEGAVLAVAAVALGGLAGIFGARRRSEADELARLRPSPSPTPAAATGSANPSAAASASTAAGGDIIGDLASLKQAGSEVFSVPSTGDPGVLVVLADGSVVAYDAICTHAGCTVEYDPSQRVLACPCHGAVFDSTNHGAVLAGPTNIPLPELPIKIDQQTGRITLTA
ncbi:MAG: TQO small subunit DoxD [Candidatus Limnocylindrales bacterium]